MWHWALEWSRTRKARRAAVAAISPIVEDSRHRLGGISDVAWSDPYIIGFMVMLISIIARLESGKISERLAVPSSSAAHGKILPRCSRT